MKKSTKKALFKVDWLSVILLLVGGINWGLVGLLNYNLVQDIIPSIANIIYSAVGIGAVWILGRSAMGDFMKK